MSNSNNNSPHIDSNQAHISETTDIKVNENNYDEVTVLGDPPQISPNIIDNSSTNDPTTAPPFSTLNTTQDNNNSTSDTTENSSNHDAVSTRTAAAANSPSSLEMDAVTNTPTAALDGNVDIETSNSSDAVVADSNQALLMFNLDAPSTIQTQQTITDNNIHNNQPHHQDMDDSKNTNLPSTNLTTVSEASTQSGAFITADALSGIGATTNNNTEGKEEN